MKVIEPSYEIIKYDGSDEQQVLKHLEMCGRTCYKSDHKIRQGSAETFVKGLMKAGHGAMIEHASVMFQVPLHLMKAILELKYEYHDESTDYRKDWYFETAVNFMNISILCDDKDGYCLDDPEEPEGNEGYYTTNPDKRMSPNCLISGNIRTWRNLLSNKYFYFRTGFYRQFQTKYPTFLTGLSPLIRPEEKLVAVEEEIKFVSINKYSDRSILKWLHKYVSVRFICNRGYSHELVRMRPCSFAQESSRYVDYSDESDRGKGEIKAIKPEWFTAGEMLSYWTDSMIKAEERYQYLRKLGASPGEARGVLPIDVKTEIVITTNLAEWYHIFKLRTANTAHPSMVQLMRPLCEEFKKEEPEIFEDIVY